MAWQGNPTSKQQDGLGINPAPNVRQKNSNLSDIRSSEVQSEDTGRIQLRPLDQSATIPLVGPYNKEFAIRRDNDKTEDFSVSLLDVDTTIINHMSSRLDLSIMDNGELVKVPILYASPERWNSVKRDGYLRDNQGKILLPAILIKRTAVANNKDLMTLNRYLSYQVVAQFNEKNKYDKFNILNVGNPFKNNPTKQIFNVTLPDHVVITYECMLWTDYVDQNNKLLEKINFGTHDYWGVGDFRFRTRIDDYTNTVELGAGEDRNVKTTFNLTVNAYLLPKTIDGVKSTTFKTFTVRKIVVSDSLVDSNQMNSLQQNQNIAGPYSYLKDAGVVYRQTTPAAVPELKLDPVIVNIPFHPAPKTTADYGESGWLAYDANYIYVYQNPSGWARKLMSTFDFGANDTRPINTAFRVFQRFPDKFYHQVPYQSSDYGQDGWISYDGSYFYIYSAGVWHRVPISVITEAF